MTGPEADASAHALAEATARSSYSRLLAYLAAHTRDIVAAEDALADAFARALETWPVKGCPTNPQAWLLTVARRKSIDDARRRVRGDAVQKQLEILGDMDSEDLSEIPDRRLGLMFACTHPAIDRGIRAPLMLQVVLGLNATTIASVFMVSPSTMGQRLVRAKNKLRQAGVPFTVPAMKELPGRLDAVLEAVYAAYAEGWNDPAGTDPARRELAEEALFLGAMLCELLPGEPEALGLLALMLHAEARRSSRRDENGDFVPLAKQDINAWDATLIRKAEATLRRAGALGRIGRFQIEAALQSAHVHRCRSGENNWPAILGLYDTLYRLTGSPVVAVNRVLAVAESRGPEEGLKSLDNIEDKKRLQEYQPYWAVRADLLARTGQIEAASHAYEIAQGLEKDPAVRNFLRLKRQALAANQAQPAAED